MASPSRRDYLTKEREVEIKKHNIKLYNKMAEIFQTGAGNVAPKKIKIRQATEKNDKIYEDESLSDSEDKEITKILNRHELAVSRTIRTPG